MLNHRQRMILQEAAKHGGANISVPEQMAKAINEARNTMSFDEIVAEIKSSLKATFPKHTFSVRKGMATYTPRLTVTLIAGPTAFSYEPDGTPTKSVHINPFHTDYYKQGKEFTDKVVAIVTKRRWDESDAQIDYFSTNFYFDIDQGANTRPFVLTDASGKKPLDPTQKIRPSTAWQGKTIQIKGSSGKPITVAADNAYGSAMRFSKKETAQAFSDKHKLGGIIASSRYRSLYYVLVNSPVKEEVGNHLVSEAVEYKINDPRLVKAARDALPPKHSTNPQTVTKMAQVMWHMWADSDGTIKIGELARLARVRLGINEEVDVDESVSMPRDQRIARVKQNQDKIDRIKAYIAAKGLPLELQDTVGKRLPWLTTYNQRLGTEEWLKRGPSAWVNQEGLYVGREIDRIINVLKHHGIAIPHLESVDEDGEEITEYYRRAGFRSSSYSGDPRWITAKYAGVDAHGKPFKKGEKVLYFPNGKKFYTGPEAEKAWLEFLSAKGDEEGMPFAM